MSKIFPINSHLEINEHERYFTEETGHVFISNHTIKTISKILTSRLFLTGNVPKHNQLWTSFRKFVGKAL
jgi:hypothetical protein